MWLVGGGVAVWVVGGGAAMWVMVGGAAVWVISGGAAVWVELWWFEEESTNMKLAPIGLLHIHSQSDQDSFVHSSARLFIVYGTKIFFMLLYFSSLCCMYIPITLFLIL